MRTCGILWMFALGAILLCPSPGHAATATEAFADGEALLTKGDFHGALTAYAAAARADRANSDYVQRYALVRRVVDLRAQLAAEKDPERWQNLARSLHAFYVGERVYSEALALDRQIFARIQDAPSAAMLAETQLAMGLSGEAVETLRSLEPGKATPATQALLGIALARDGRPEEARRIAAELSLPQDAGPGVVYAAARLHAAVGQQDKAIASLRTCFESVLPSRLDVFKAHARQCPEFAALAATAGFAEVLLTKSKLAESGCSGGSSCAGCPMRGKCAGHQQ